MKLLSLLSLSRPITRVRAIWQLVVVNLVLLVVSGLAFVSLVLLGTSGSGELQLAIISAVIILALYALQIWLLVRRAKTLRRRRAWWSLVTLLGLVFWPIGALVTVWLAWQIERARPGD
jgi:hypothetical protein